MTTESGGIGEPARPNRGPGALAGAIATGDAILAAHGVDMARAKAAIAAPDTTRHIADIHTTAAALRLRGTPTFFVNGKASPGIDPAEIGKLIEAAKR